ncbi:NAD-dependent epimerase/dehydratase family protein [Micromonospora sp. WMMB482]|nr:NAD-dependent epimerase/dehydratase family protein [Micromonospora sp. WMMB482]MBU8861842.1 NAD-dependent epimerase/dehydratase family protein [Micromonospora sp. WMMB482]
MRVLISGGVGFIGSTVASALTDAGNTPVVLDNLVIGRREICRGRAFQLGDAGVRRPAAGARRTPVDLQLVAAIYAPDADIGVDETSPLAAGSPYAQTKLVVERMLADIAASSPLRVLSLCYFNPIGADPALRTGLQTSVPSHALGRLMLAHRAGVPFAVNGFDWPTRDGSGLRDYVHVWDLAAAHLRALERFDDIFAVGAAPHVAVNLGSGTGTTVLELVAVVDRPVLVREAPRRPGDAAGAYARGRRARELLGWRARRDLATGIADSLAWHDRRERLLGDLAPRRRQLAG